MSNNINHLTPEEVATRLGVSRRTLSRWHALRVGPPRVSVGRTILYRQKSVDAWLEANETQPTRSFSGDVA